MKIQSKKQAKARVSSDLPTGRLMVNQEGRPGFPDVLDQHSSPQEEEQLARLLTRLEEIGRRLSKSFSVYDLKNYKDTLRNFLSETQGNIYALKEVKSWTRQGKPRAYQCLQQIDQELENLSRLVLAKQKDPLKILEKMDQIRGLLVDLYS